MYATKLVLQMNLINCSNADTPLFCCDYGVHTFLLVQYAWVHVTKCDTVLLPCSIHWPFLQIQFLMVTNFELNLDGISR